MVIDELYNHLKESNKNGNHEEIPLWDFSEEMQEELAGIGERKQSRFCYEGDTDGLVIISRRKDIKTEIKNNIQDGYNK